MSTVRDTHYWNNKLKSSCKINNKQLICDSINNGATNLYICISYVFELYLKTYNYEYIELFEYLIKEHFYASTVEIRSVNYIHFTDYSYSEIKHILSDDIDNDYC